MPQSTLRTWERRYGVPNPNRDARGNRLYSEQDLSMVEEMANLLERGMSASVAATVVGTRPADPQSAHMTLLVTLSKVAAHFPNGSINIFDRDLRYTFAEGLGLKAVGLSSGSLVGRSLDELFPAESVEIVRPYYERAFAGESVLFELSVFGRRYSMAAGPLEVSPEGVSTILAVAQDITSWLDEK